MKGSTDLAKKMHALADKGHAEADALRAKAEAFDASFHKHMSEGSQDTAKAMAGAWARARQLWCALTGEPLI
ncbi:MAG TPA: hypothetical protein VGD46_19530 [Rhizobacter sp.]